MKKVLAVFLVTMMTFLAACGTQSNPAESVPASSGEEQKEAVEVSAEEAAEEPAAEEAAAKEPADPYAPMTEKVTITMGKELASDPKLGPDSTIEDNDLTRYLSERLNIEYVHAWQASNVQDAYKSKVSISIASGDMPDTLVVDRTQLQQMAEAGLLEDLTEVYNEYASPSLKASYESTGGYSLDSATFDGKLMAIPNVSPGADGVNLAWIRQDWMDELNLSAPETLDDILEMVQIFQEKKGAIGLLGSANLVNMAGNSIYGFDTIFSSFDAYPQMWYKNEQGEVVYGSTQPEVKEALAKLSEMYQKGLIDNEFAIKTTQQSDEAVASGKAGIVFGPWWQTYLFADSMTQDPNAVWVPYAAPIADNGKMKTHMIAPTKQYLVVKKGFEHPDAVMKTINIQHDIDQMNVDQMRAEGILVNDPEYQWALMPFTILLSNFDDKESKALVVQDVIDGKTSADSLTGEAVQIYQAYVNDEANPRGEFYTWAQRMANVDACLLLSGDKVEKKIGVFYDQTETMSTKWVNLRKLEDQTFLKIIMGTEPIDAFDEFVEKWNAQGGEQITQEVIAAVQ